ncbi:MAG: hypothetical protein LAT68_15690, partial [Cyclobacteriaceae bacterium]|nr:hypothetical protein [Cyclobacteriaceae bacterium]
VTPALKGFIHDLLFSAGFMNASHFTHWNSQLFDLYSPFKAHTKCSSNKGFSGYSNVIPRIKFRVG